MRGVWRHGGHLKGQLVRGLGGVPLGDVGGGDGRHVDGGLLRHQQVVPLVVDLSGRERRETRGSQHQIYIYITLSIQQMIFFQGDLQYICRKKEKQYIAVGSVRIFIETSAKH